jgi:cation diffusion facilitator CzcD-associated flavoprotein CzcO
MVATDPEGIELAIDPDALKKRYAEERERRMGADSGRIHIDIDDDDPFFRDPRADPDFTRPPVMEDVDVLVIGGGFAGLMIASRLRKAGVDSFRIVDKAGDFGGNWYWNRYPGAACDTEAYIYMPLLEDMGYVPSEKYAKGTEIFEYSRMIGRHFDLYAKALFQTQVTEMRWMEEPGRWLVKTSRGDEMRTRFLVIAAGQQLHRPKLPAIPGVKSFKGRSFHTSRWDYGYTGGSPDGDLVGLRDKRVGVIGTGASGVQVVPVLAQAAMRLYVFQRTPSSVDVRGNVPTDPHWARALDSGWQDRRMDNFNSIIMGAPVEEDLVRDSWTRMFSALSGAATRGGSGDARSATELVQLADFERQERIRRRVEEVVSDPTTAEALKPWYNILCKRPCFHDQYLEAFNRPNVTLVDTRGRGIEEITEHGVVVADRRYEVDCLIYATGYEANSAWTHRNSFEIYGRHGSSLTEIWGNRVRTFFGIQISGFPNYFMIGGPQIGITANYVASVREPVAHIAFIIEHCLAETVKVLDVKPSAEARWQQAIADKASPALRDTLRACTPGYFNGEGVLESATWFTSNYGGGLMEYERILRAWRTGNWQDDMEFNSRMLEDAPTPLGEPDLAFSG